MMGSPSLSGTRQVARCAQLAEFFLLLLRYQPSFLTTCVSDLETVQELTIAVSSSETTQTALSILGAMKKSGIWKKSNCGKQYFSQLCDEVVAICDGLSVASMLSEMSDHPYAQEKYESLWAAHHGMRCCTDRHERSSSLLFDDISLAVEVNGCGSILTSSQRRRLNRIDLVLVGDIIGYFLRETKHDRRAFLANVTSLFQLTMRTMDVPDL
jgi:hypothetical protein